MNASRPLNFELISQKAKTHAFKYIDKLNVWGLNIGDISILKDLPNLKVIILSVNCINTLEPFSHCSKLEEIYLRKNLITDLSQLEYLKVLPNLKVLLLSDNPVCRAEGYRQEVVRILPQL
jgi:Leucine-rich repeat (LRR) protein